MVDASGVPRPYTPASLSNQLAAVRRELELRSSQRNGSRSSLSSGDILDVLGGLINVLSGTIDLGANGRIVSRAGGIHLLESGVIEVQGSDVDFAGVPYTVSLTLTNAPEDRPDYTALVPAILLRSSENPDWTGSIKKSTYGDGILIHSRSGDSTNTDAPFSTAEVANDSVLMVSGITGDQATTGFPLAQSGVEVTPDYAELVHRASPPGSFVEHTLRVDQNGLTFDGEPVGGGPTDWEEILNIPTIVQNLQQELDARQSKISSYTCTGSKANQDAANQEIATPIYVSSESDTNLATPGAGSLTVTAAGNYAVMFSVTFYGNAALTIGRVITGRTFLDISDATPFPYSRTGVAVGEDKATGNVAGIKLAAGSVLKFLIYQTSGSTAYYRAKISLVKLP